VSPSTLWGDGDTGITVALSTYSGHIVVGDPPFGRWALLLFAAVATVDGSRRQCSRPGCADRAVAMLTYDYGRSRVWLDHLPAERDPHAYDLCVRHAETLSVPLGWKLSDNRAPAFCRLEPTGTEQY